MFYVGQKSPQIQISSKTSGVRWPGLFIGTGDIFQVSKNYFALSLVRGTKLTALTLKIKNNLFLVALFLLLRKIQTN